MSVETAHESKVSVVPGTLKVNIDKKGINVMEKQPIEIYPNELQQGDEFRHRDQTLTVLATATPMPDIGTTRVFYVSQRTVSPYPTDMPNHCVVTVYR